MHTIEELLSADREQLGSMLAEAKVAPQGDTTVRRARIAQAFGLRSAQMLCGIGFNPVTETYPTAIHYLGFNSFEALASERNYQFVHDRYEDLSVDNVLEIYSVIGSDTARREQWAELVMTRLTTIESLLEETINPILIGGYKLEIRGIYEYGLAAPALVEVRAARTNAVLREIANECAVMLETNTLGAKEFLQAQGITVEEKLRAISQGFIAVTEARDYLKHADGSDADKQLAAAIEHA